LGLIEPLELSIDIRNANLFSHNQNQIWKNLSFALQPSQIHAIIGESGSGKTTFAYSIFGILPKHWKLHYEEWRVLGKTFEEKQGTSSVFLVPQNPNLAFHPERNLEVQLRDFFRYTLKSPFDPDRILSLWEEMGINLGPKTLARYPNSFSGGEKQRICLSLALLARPRILILDEPTTGLDAEAEYWALSQIKRMVGEYRSGVIFISHDLRIVESLASQITIMKEGSVVETTPVKESKFEPKSDYGKALEKARLLFH